MTAGVVHSSFAIERRYGCAPHQVFSAFADPELERQWFANPGNWPNAVWEVDFRVGGGEISSGGSPGCRHNAFRSRYHDIVPDERRPRPRASTGQASCSTASTRCWSERRRHEADVV